MRRKGGMDDDGGAMPPKNEVQLQLVSKCEKRSFVSISPPVPMDQVHGCKDKCNRHMFGALPMHNKYETKTKIDISKVNWKYVKLNIKKLGGWGSVLCV